MAEPCQVKMTVTSVTGHCAAGHKVGDSWVLGSKTPEGICVSGFVACVPSFRVLRFGGEFPWSQDKDTAIAACPDAANPVVFELRRVRPG